MATWSRTWVGTGRLIALALRRDRWLIATWLTVLTATVYASAAGTAQMYPTATQRIETATALNASPVVVGLYGPILDPASLGELAMTKMTVLYSVLVAVMFLFLARRHTRLAEEQGQIELLGGTAISRNAPLLAAGAEAALTAFGLAALVAGASILGGLPAEGSVLFALSWAGTALVFTAATMVSCQVYPSARACALLAGGLVGLAYVTRAVGDANGWWSSWLSPLAWNTQLRPWSQPRLWVLLLYVAATVSLVILSLLLRALRDTGAGLLSERAGAARADKHLHGVLTLQLKLLRPMYVAWTVAAIGGGLTFAAMVPGLSSLLNSPQAMVMMQRLGGMGKVYDTMMGSVLLMLALAVGCFGVAVVMHTSDDERSRRLELLMATSTTRARVFWSGVMVAGLGTLTLLVLIGLAAWIGWSAAGPNPPITDLVVAATAYLPAVWVVVSLTLLAHAISSRFAALGWVLLICYLVLMVLVGLFDLPAWVSKLSPFAFTPRLPAEHFRPVPLLIMTGLSCLITVGAWFRYRRRDLA